MKIQTTKEMIRESLMMRLNLYFTNITFSMNLAPMLGVKQARQHFFANQTYTHANHAIRANRYSQFT